MVWDSLIISVSTLLFYKVFLCQGQCQKDAKVITAWNGHIKSPNYPSYEANLDCSWVIQVPLGNILKISFRDFSMSSIKDKDKYDENCSDANDYVKIHDGNTTSSPVLHKLCGWRKVENLLSTKNVFLLQMITATHNTKGFLLNFEGICHVKMKEYNGIIQTPNFPSNYPSRTECLWLIDFGQGMDVTVKFKSFDVEGQPECDYDYITLHTGKNKSAPQLGDQYCGTELPKERSVTGPLSIYFTSDDDTEKRGFELEYKAIDRNECELGNDCHSNSTCSNTIGSYTCTCKHSYRGDGKTCQWYREFDECSDDTIHDCHEHAQCIDTREGFYCKCKSGFKGDGRSCLDVNECKESDERWEANCHQNATCTNLIGSFRCECIETYEGDGFECKDRNECMLGLYKCHENAECLNTDGSYTCKCKDGYQDDGKSCVDINECFEDIDDCHVDSSCRNTISSYFCTCNTGHYGNGQECDDLDECKFHLDNCHKDAKCTNIKSSFLCQCNPGFTGDGIECMDNNECNNVNRCHSNAMCTNTPGSYECRCNRGFAGDGIKCEDIDECSLKIYNCHSNATCLNSNGSYACQCVEGLIGDGVVCQDYDECRAGVHDCHMDATCTNVLQSYLCKCNNGFSGNGTYCEDINECETTNVCNKKFGKCINAVGSYICKCEYGLIGNGVNCREIEYTLYMATISVLGLQWDSRMVDTNTVQFKNMAKKIKDEVSVLYEGEADFLGSNVTRVTFGSIRASITLNVTAKSNKLIGKFIAASTRGKIGGLDVKPNSFNVRKLGRYSEKLCSRYAYYVEDERGLSQCQCYEGYEGNGLLCVDNNECQNVNGGCQQQCINLQGTFTCACNIGFKLSANQRTCEVENNPRKKTSYCKNEYFQGIQWYATTDGNIVKMECPNNKIIGYAIRKCMPSGIWKNPDLTRCTKDELLQLRYKVSSVNIATASWLFINGILKSLPGVTQPSMHVLYAGDILQSEWLFSQMVKYLKKNLHLKEFKEIQNIFQVLCTVLDNIFDISNHGGWLGIPKPWKTIEDILSTISTMATVFSKYMVTRMEENSIKYPELLPIFHLRSRGKELVMEIKTVETTRFTGFTFEAHVTNESSYTLKYNQDLLKKPAEFLVKQKGFYKSIGCWADHTRETTELSLETSDSLLMDNFLKRDNAIEKCGTIANRLNYNMFALRDGGWCVSGPNLHKTFDRDGKGKNCTDGKGSRFSNSVYQIRKFYTGILTVSYKTLGTLLQSLLTDSHFPHSETNMVALGEVLTSSVLNNQSIIETKDMIKIKFQVTGNQSSTGFTCLKLSESNNQSVQWVNDGCTTTYNKENTVECTCNSTSHFLLVCNFTSVMKKESKIEEMDIYHIMVIITFVITCFCLFATLALYIKYLNLKSSLLFQANMIFVIVVTETIYVFGISSQAYIEKVYCKWLTIIFQFSLTSIFAWILALSWQSYHRLNDLIKQINKFRMASYVLLGYGLPALITLISIAIFYQDFGTSQNDMCWLSSTILVSVFLPPIVVLIVFTMIVLGMVIGVYFSPRSTHTFTHSKMSELDREEIYLVRDNVRGTAIMLSIATITWIFGILRVIKNEDFTKYMFLLLHLLQGIGYLVAYSFLNKQISQHFYCSPTFYIDDVTEEQFTTTSPSFGSLSFFKNRSRDVKQGQYPASLSKATAYNGSNFVSMKGIPYHENLRVPPSLHDVKF